MAAGQNIEVERTSGLELLLRGGALLWFIVGATQVAHDVGDITAMTLGEPANDNDVDPLPVLDLTYRQAFLADLFDFSNGGGPEDNDDDWFKNMIMRAISVFGLNPRTLERALHIPPGSVQKWFDGTNAPRPRARRYVVRIILLLMGVRG